MNLKRRDKYITSLTYFIDESDIKTIDCALPDERFDNLAGLEPLTTC